MGNSAVSVVAETVEFAGNKTLTPYFTEPYPLQSIRETFTITFTLPESAKAGL